MQGRRKRNESGSMNLQPPSLDPVDRENQLISLAVDLAEKQLAEGTASSQVITHYLKLGSTRERLEKEKLVKENELLRAKTEAIKESKKIEELYINAINAMKMYNGQSIEKEDSDDEELY